MSHEGSNNCYGQKKLKIYGVILIFGVSIDPTAPFNLCIRLGLVRSSHLPFRSVLVR